MLLYILL